MKVCVYCGSECEEDVKVCPSCGGDEFKAKCHNCGTVFGAASFCPNCGVKVGDTGKECPRCGTRYFSPACPNCGYNALRPEGEDDAVSTGQAPFSKSGCNLILWIIGWLLLFPVPLTILILRKRNLPNWAKVCIIIAAWLVFLVLILTAQSESDTQQNQMKTGGSAYVTSEDQESGSYDPATTTSIFSSSKDFAY